MMHLRSLSLLAALGSLGLASCATHVVVRGPVPLPPPPPAVVVGGPIPPPPAPLVEVRPPLPFVGAVWIPGHWRWNGRRHVWMHGHYRAV